MKQSKRSKQIEKRNKKIKKVWKKCLKEMKRIFPMEIVYAQLWDGKEELDSKKTDNGTTKI